MLTLGFLLLLAVFGEQKNKLIWREGAEIPHPVAGYMAGAVDGELVVAGGSYWEAGRKRRISAVQCFNPATNVWRSGTPLPQPRSDAAIATLQHRMYIFGGDLGTEVRRDAIVLDRGKWETLPAADLPELRIYPKAVVAADHIYLLGGMRDASEPGTIANSLWRWRPGSVGWKACAPLPGMRRIHFAMAELHGNVYVFGGATPRGQGWENLNDCYRYDTPSDAWEMMGDLPIANRSWSAVGLNERILLLAGYTTDFAREVYIYDPRQELQVSDALPRGLADIKFCRVGNMLVGAGGETEYGLRGKWTFGAVLPESWCKHARDASGRSL